MIVEDAREDVETTAGGLLQELKRLMSDDAKCGQMAEASKGCADLKAAAKVAESVTSIS